MTIRQQMTWASLHPLERLWDGGQRWLFTGRKKALPSLTCIKEPTPRQDKWHKSGKWPRADQMWETGREVRVLRVKSGKTSLLRGGEI